MNSLIKVKKTYESVLGKRESFLKSVQECENVLHLERCRELHLIWDCSCTGGIVVESGRTKRNCSDGKIYGVSL
jgi:hypothetical protein